MRVVWGSIGQQPCVPALFALCQLQVVAAAQPVTMSHLHPQHRPAPSANRSPHQTCPASSAFPDWSPATAQPGPLLESFNIPRLDSTNNHEWGRLQLSAQDRGSAATAASNSATAPLPGSSCCSSGSDIQGGGRGTGERFLSGVGLLTPSNSCTGQEVAAAAVVAAAGELGRGSRDLSGFELNGSFHVPAGPAAPLHLRMSPQHPSAGSGPFNAGINSSEMASPPIFQHPYRQLKSPVAHSDTTSAPSEPATAAAGDCASVNDQAAESAPEAAWAGASAGGTLFKDKPGRSSHHRMDIERAGSHNQCQPAPEADSMIAAWADTATGAGGAAAEAAGSTISSTQLVRPSQPSCEWMIQTASACGCF
jgi:hypothetical protein